MSGNYMDAPNDRIAWDRDGSILTMVTAAGEVTNTSGETRRILNSENGSLSFAGSLAIVFSLPMNLTALFVSSGQSDYYYWRVATSKDTTNGLDGVWSMHLGAAKASELVSPFYRVGSSLMTLLANSTSSDVRGLRISPVTSAGIPAGTPVVKAFHVYGTPSSLATKDRLALWHPTLDVKTPPEWFDWGNVPRSSSADKQFRIKNLSTNRSANTIDVYIESLTPGVPSMAGMHTLSNNGGATFLTSLTLTRLAPGETSGLITLRRVVPGSAQVSVWSARIAADVNQWIGV